MNTLCGYYNQGICRSCGFMTLDYHDQVQNKEKILLESLSRLKLPPLLPSVVSKPFGFRNKAKFVVTGTLDNPVIGLLGEADMDQGRELLECPLHLTAINETLPVLREFIQHARLVPYNIETKKGELKGLILFYSESSQEMYVRFVCRSQEPVTRIKKFQPELLKKIPRLKVISVNIQPIPHAILEGEEEIITTEETFLRHEIGGIQMHLGPRAFVQTNQHIAEKLYQTAAQWINEEKTKRFLELFCGQGAFSFFAASSVEEALGIEINTDAVKEANGSAQRMNLHHLNFISRDAASVQEEMEAFSPDLILVNPPRAGLKNAVDLLMTSKPSTIIYSSCNYETLGKDLEKLGPCYEVKRIQLFDMFPQTEHFEVLVQLGLTESVGKS